VTHLTAAAIVFTVLFVLVTTCAGFGAGYFVARRAGLRRDPRRRALLYRASLLAEIEAFALAVLLDAPFWAAALCFLVAGYATFFVNLKAPRRANRQR
jgi:hypothetical protein